MKGGTQHGSCPMCHSAGPPHGVPALHQPDARRVSAAGPAFEAAFQARMATWRLDGKPRTTRQLRVEKTCPVPTCEDRLFCWFCRNVACSRVWKSASHCFPDTQLLDCAQKTTFATELLCPLVPPKA